MSALENIQSITAAFRDCDRLRVIFTKQRPCTRAVDIDVRKYDGFFALWYCNQIQWEMLHVAASIKPPISRERLTMARKIAGMRIRYKQIIEQKESEIQRLRNKLALLGEIET